MKLFKTDIILLFWLLLVNPLASFGYQQVDSSFVDIEKIIQERVNGGEYVGIVVGIVDEKGRKTFCYGYTAKDKNLKVDEKTVFEIGSITKVFTTLLLADFVENKTARLDDSIDQYLPVTVSLSRGKEITPRALATHSSGLPRLPNNLFPKDLSNPYADYSTFQLYQFISKWDFSARAKKYEYSNLGMALLGHILERISGENYESLVVNKICKPLGMNDTKISLSPELQFRLAEGHDQTGKKTANWDMPAFSGAGALRSTVNDMLIFLEANLGLLETPLHSAMAFTHRKQVQIEPSVSWIGLGWHIKAINGLEYLWHNGGTGGYRSFLGLCQKKKIGVVILANSANSVDDIGWHILDQKIKLSEPFRPAHQKLAIEIGLGNNAKNFTTPVARISFNHYFYSHPALSIRLRPFLGYAKFGGKDRSNIENEFLFETIEMGLWGEFVKMRPPLPFSNFFKDILISYGFKINRILTTRLISSSSQTYSMNNLSDWAFQSGFGIGYNVKRYFAFFDTWDDLKFLEKGRIFNKNSQFKANHKKVTVGVVF
jgi:CubicO group peptidase (beta-lactamase class C family)